MKHSDELKITKGEKVARMTALIDAQKGENKRALTDDENKEFTRLKGEVENLNTEIENAEFVERNGGPVPQRPVIVAPHIKRESAAYSVGKAMREFARGNDAAGLTGREKEQHDELSRGVSSTGLLVPYQYQRAANTTTTHATSIDVNIDPNLSILGKEPLWQQMGLTILPGLHGQIKLGKKTPDQATKVAEAADLTAESNVPSFVTLSPERFGITDIFTKELLAQENPAVQAAIVADMVKGCDRGLTAEVYTVALAAATEVAAGALTVAGFDALMAAVDIDGAFAMDRGSFFEAKAVKLDAGSGLFLTSLGAENGVARSYDGAKIFYSTLFADGANKQYAIYGAWSEMYIGLWDALEILINPYTYQKSGQIEMTVNRLADTACRNSAAFVKSPDLDAAV